MDAGMDDAQIQELARLAGLELGAERRAAVLAQLAGLLAEAGEVNAFMAARREVPPGIRFDAWGVRDGE
jgi:hypothetical protein